MNRIKETNRFAEKSPENVEVEIPTFCPSCLNSECVELIDEGDEQDADGVFGNYHFRCSVCGRRDRQHGYPGRRAGSMAVS